jgi:hypothetical protein
LYSRNEYTNFFFQTNQVRKGSWTKGELNGQINSDRGLHFDLKYVFSVEGSHHHIPVSVFPSSYLRYFFEDVQLAPDSSSRICGLGLIVQRSSLVHGVFMPALQAVFDISVTQALLSDLFIALVSANAW